MDKLKFGITNAVKSYFTKSAFSNMDGLVKSRFGNIQEDPYEYGVYDSEDVKKAYALSNLFIAVLIITGVIIGFVAVPHLCSDATERGKNVRLALYFLLILTGGQLGWFLGLLWLFNINICA